MTGQSMTGQSMTAGWIAAGIGFALLLFVWFLWFAWLARKRSSYPIREVRGFLSVGECEHLIRKAEPELARSQVALRAGSGRGFDRDSASAFLSHAGDPIIRGIKERVAELSGIPVENQEKIQVTHYSVNQRYEPHYDSLRAFGVDPGPAGDRVATVIIYLNDDYAGGNTSFPRVRRRIRPERGKAVLFRNLIEGSDRWNRLAYHAGEPVKGGEKWLCNQWIRQRARVPARAKSSRRKRRK